MTRILATIGLVSSLCCFAATAQTTTSTTSSSTSAALADKSPSENVRLGRVAERAPSKLVQEAIARHQGLATNRLQFQHNGLAGASSSSNSSSSSSSNSSSSSTLNSLISSLGNGGTTSLNNLLGTFLGSGGLNSLQGLDLTSLLGGTSSSSSSSSNSTNSNIPSNITPEVIAMLQSAGIDINSLYPPSGSSNSSSSQKASSSAKEQSSYASPLLDRWPTKTGQRQQTSNSTTGTTTNTGTTTDQPRFVVRWGNAMLSTLFTGMVVGVNTPQFLDLIKNNIRPILRPDLTNKSSSAKSAQSNGALVDDEAAELQPDDETNETH